MSLSIVFHLLSLPKFALSICVLGKTIDTGHNTVASSRQRECFVLTMTVMIQFVITWGNEHGNGVGGGIARRQDVLTGCHFQIDLVFKVLKVLFGHFVFEAFYLHLRNTFLLHYLYFYFFHFLKFVRSSMSLCSNRSYLCFILLFFPSHRCT